MKIIFLDMDGVMNSQRSVIEEHEWRKTNSPRAKGTCYWMAPYHIDPLNRIIKETEAKIVISSVWRYSNSASDMQKFLDSFGFMGEVIDITPRGRICMEGFYFHYGSVPRGSEIQEWLNKNEVESFVILDDDSDMQILSHRHIKCDSLIGLTEELANKAIECLNNPN